MAYVFLFLFLVFITMLLIFIKHEKLSKKNRIIAFFLSFAAVLIIVIYQLNFDKKSSQNREKINHFNQGKILTCKEYVVDSENFSFFGGTNSFVAKDKDKSLKGVILKLEDCEMR